MATGNRVKHRSDVGIVEDRRKRARDYRWRVKAKQRERRGACRKAGVVRSRVAITQEVIDVPGSLPAAIKSSRKLNLRPGSGIVVDDHLLHQVRADRHILERGQRWLAIHVQALNLHVV